MPILDPVSSPNALAIVNSAILWALLDVLIANGTLSKDQMVSDIFDKARGGLGARAQTIEGAEAVKVFQSLRDHFAKK